MPYARYLLVAATLAAIAHPASAQTATPSPASSAKEEMITLNPFVVETSTNEGYLSSSATAAGRVAQQLENVPQQVAIYNAAFLADIKLNSFQDALRYDSNTNFSNSEFNGTAGIIRGFAAGVLRNGAGARDNPLGVEAIEQVEVVKGPAAVLYGPGQPGGVINYVTKHPQFRAQTTVEGQYFAQGGYKASIDSTGPLGLKSSDGRSVLAYRVVLAHEGRSLYQINGQDLHRDLYYGALTYQPFKALTFDLEVESARQKASFFNSDLSTQPVVNGLANGSIKPSEAPLPYGVYPGGATWTYQDTYGFIAERDKYAQFSAVLNHDFGRLGNWTLRAHYTWSKSDLLRILDDITNGNFPQPVTAADIGRTVNFTQTVTAADVTAGRLWIPNRYIRRIDGYPVATLNAQWDLTGKFFTGPLNHTLLIGTDGDLGSKVYSSVPGVGGYERQAYVGAAGQVNAIWVDSPDLRAISNINWNDIRNAATNPTGLVVNNIPSNTGKRADLNDNMRIGVPWLTIPKGGNYDKNVYFFDAISLLEERLQVSLGARYDNIGQFLGKQFTATDWTYRYGAVYKLRPEIQLFALHNESFLPNSTAASQAFGYFVEPQRGKQEEAGVRLSLFQKRVLLSASAYKITSTNIVQNNPFGNVGVVPPIPANNFVFVPGITNKGFDVDATINLSKNSQLIASYAHYDIMNAAGPAQLAQGIKEFPVNNVPNNQYSLWAKYTVPSGRLLGLSLNAGYRYVGRRPAGGIGSVPALYLNAYEIVDAGIGYTRGSWTFSVLTRNVFDKFAFRLASSTSRLYPEQPRETSFTIAKKF